MGSGFLILKIIVQSAFMLIVYWLGFEMGKLLYSRFYYWNWTFDRSAFWNIYFLIWQIVFLIFNIILFLIRKCQHRKPYAFLIVITLWAIPLVLFKEIITSRPMSVLAVHIAALPPLLLRFLFYLKTNQ